MQAFIVRPFGTKEGIDFEAVQEQLIAPALAQADIAGGTTGCILEAGNIREDMFQLLLLADVVIADISIHNANVFYELGIRHALRGRQTFLLRANTQFEVPFDLKTDRYLSYDPANPAATLPDLVRGLLATKASNRVDSPVFRSLPQLREPERTALSPVPLDYVNDLELAASKSQGGKMGLLALEASRFLWEESGRRVAGRVQFQCHFLKPAKETWERVRSVYPLDLEANLMLGTVYQRLGELTESDQSLRTVLGSSTAEPSQKAEALALRARNQKARGNDAWAGKDLAGRRLATVRADFFFEARKLYAEAFEHDLNHSYSGLNALSLSVLLQELIAEERDAWLAGFDTEDEARLIASEISRSRDRLEETVDSSLLAGEKRGQDDGWAAISRADFRFLTSARDTAVVAAYERALAGAPPFQTGAARGQLELFESLGVRAARVAACLAVFPPKPPDAEPLRHAVVFTGHRIDRQDRESPRFPASKEAAVRAAIRKDVLDLRAAYPGRMLGIAGGANGGDILFHEVCAELGIPTRVLLTLPEGLFIPESVADGGNDWVRRFNALMESHPEKNAVQVLCPGKELPVWMRNLSGYDVWQRTNIWLMEEGLSCGARALSLLALWDGKAGDGPGGTKDLVDLARKYGIQVTIRDPANVG
ncbi:MAG: tetratricopeptide repeat-containing protein [Bryobacteraceae bacterium]|nr:tetratricopeptide repeat-containing protein [Bryobacteraceae bacterium]